MHGLKITLIIKIGFTVILWATPLLLFTDSFMTFLGFPPLGPLIFRQLLGMAMFSLVLGYLLGLNSVLNGNYPSITILVGILSNGGSFILLLIAAMGSAWEQWGMFAKWVMWISLFATGAITGGLVAFGPFRKQDANDLNKQKVRT